MSIYDQFSQFNWSQDFTWKWAIWEVTLWEKELLIYNYSSGASKFTVDSMGFALLNFLFLECSVICLSIFVCWCFFCLSSVMIFLLTFATYHPPFFLLMLVIYHTKDIHTNLVSHKFPLVYENFLVPLTMNLLIQREVLYINMKYM